MGRKVTGIQRSVLGLVGSDENREEGEDESEGDHGPIF